jgi:GNAT superfamily N-acetyltransferase
MNLTIQKVTPEQVGALHAILEQCGLDMQAKFGLSHWIPAYPIERLREDAQTKSVYAVREAEQIIATFTIGTRAPYYYADSIWQDPNARALYVNHLAVLPAYQGKGIGAWCMQTVEQLALAEDCTALRLDAYDKHAKLHGFYRRLGYKERGKIHVITRSGKEGDAMCFEKILRTG